MRGAGAATRATRSHRTRAANRGSGLVSGPQNLTGCGWCADSVIGLVAEIPHTILIAVMHGKQLAAPLHDAPKAGYYNQIEEGVGPMGQWVRSRILAVGLAG